MRWNRAVVVVALLEACGPEMPNGVGKGEATTSSVPGTSDADATSGAAETTSSADDSTTVMSNAGSSSAGASTTEDGDADTANFIPPPDPKGTNGGECDVWAQDCHPSGKCQPWSNDGSERWNATICTIVDKAPSGVDESCLVFGGAYSGYDNCDWDTMCWAVDSATNVGTCVARCEGTEAFPSCADGLVCFLSNEGVIQLCLPSCAALAPACAGGFACARSGLGGFACVPEAMVANIGEPCDDTSGCGSGSLCVPADEAPGCAGSSCCTPLCDPMSEDACADAEQSCIELADDPGVGACRVPRA